MNLRIPHAALVALVVFTVPFTGCKRNVATGGNVEVNRLNAELGVAREKLATAEKALGTKQEDHTFATATDTGQQPPVEENLSAAPKDAQIRSLQAELAALKKSDAFLFAEASAAQQKESVAIALERYQKFFRDFPHSPLAADADRAISELSLVVEREDRSRATAMDPRHPEREILKHFAEGTATVKEVAPLLRGRSRSEVLKILGAPGQTFRDGRELGYVDKVIDTSTGKKETLVIGFESDAVSTVRLGYLGKAIKP